MSFLNFIFTSCDLERTLYMTRMLDTRNAETKESRYGDGGFGRK